MPLWAVLKLFPNKLIARAFLLALWALLFARLFRIQNSSKLPDPQNSKILQQAFRQESKLRNPAPAWRSIQSDVSFSFLATRDAY
jgi:hypothetical protein